MKKTIVILASALLALGIAAARPAPAAAQDNTAVAINPRDGASIFRLAFKIVRANQEVIDQQNIAFSFASCADCEAVAIAFQAVLIFSDPDVVTTENMAWALNYQCSECLAFAWAYQNVFTTGGPVHFTAEGNQRLAEIRRALLELRDQIDTLSYEELAARVAALQAEFQQVLAEEWVAAGPPEAETTTAAETETTTDAETTTEAEATTAETTTAERTTAETTTSP